MAVADRQKPHSDKKLFSLCPFWQSGTTNSSSSSTQNLNHTHNGNSSNRHLEVKNSSKSPSSSRTVSSIARSLLPARRRLRLDPANYLYFPCMSVEFSTRDDFSSLVNLNYFRNHFHFRSYRLLFEILRIRDFVNVHSMNYMVCIPPPTLFYFTLVYSFAFFYAVLQTLLEVF